MAEQYVKMFNADQGELSLNVGGGKHWKRFPAKKVASIKKSTVTKKSLLGTKNVDRLEININGEDTSYIIEKGKIKDDFQWITDVLKRFAEKNKVSYQG